MEIPESSLIEQYFCCCCSDSSEVGEAEEEMSSMSGEEETHSPFGSLAVKNVIKEINMQRRRVITRKKLTEIPT